MANGANGANGMKAFWWMMGVVAALLTAGVIGSIATYATVASLQTNVNLFRQQWQREMDRQEVRIRGIEQKFDRHLNDERGEI